MTWRLDHDGHNRLLTRALQGDKDIARAIGRLHRAEHLITQMLLSATHGFDSSGEIPKLYHQWRCAGGRCVGYYYADDHFDRVFNVFLRKKKG